MDFAQVRLLESTDKMMFYNLRPLGSRLDDELLWKNRSVLLFTQDKDVVAVSEVATQQISTAAAYWKRKKLPAFTLTWKSKDCFLARREAAVDKKSTLPVDIPQEIAPREMHDNTFP